MNREKDDHDDNNDNAAAIELVPATTAVSAFATRDDENNNHDGNGGGETRMLHVGGGLTSASFREAFSARPDLLEANRRLVDSLAFEDRVCRKDDDRFGCDLVSRFALTFGPIGIGVVLFWRGTWTVLDLYLFPGDAVKSGWTSLAIGVALGVVCHAVSAWQNHHHHDGCSDGDDGRVTLLSYGIKERCFSLLVSLCAISYWRGVWVLWDELVFVDNPVLQNWTCVLAGACLLFGTRSFRSSFAPPVVYMPDDADDLDGLTLELCDGLWWEPASPIRQRHPLNNRHFLRVASLLEWKKLQQQSQRASTATARETPTVMPTVAEEEA